MVLHEGIFQGQVWTNLLEEKIWSLFFKLYTVVFWNNSYSRGAQYLRADIVFSVSC